MNFENNFLNFFWIPGPGFLLTTSGEIGKCYKNDHNFFAIIVTEKADPILESLYQEKSGANIIFRNIQCFGAFSCKNLKFAIFYVSLNFLRQPFHALKMNLEYFFLQMDESNLS